MSVPEFDPKQLPPASFSFIISMIATQGGIALGIVPSPMSGKTDVRPELGKHAIDTLVILEEKTKGNLTKDESQYLETVLHQLRMAYLQVKK